MRIHPMTWILLPVLAFAVMIGFLGALFSVQLLGANTTTTTTSSFSGLELVDDTKLSLLRGCSDGEVEKFNGTSKVWECAEDSTSSVTGAGADVLDLDDDSSNESSDFNELATTSGCSSDNGQFVETITEPSADKVLFTCNAIVDGDVPDTITIDLAATATALAADPTDCGANEFADAIAASGNLTCNAIVDADVPNTITIDLAATATALAANGANCSASNAPLGVDASGAVESCTDFEEELTNSAGLAAALNDETGTNSAVFSHGATMTGTVAVTGVSSTFTLNLDCSGFDNGGTLSVTGSGVIHCQNDDGGAGAGDVSDVGDCTTGACFTEGGAGTTLYFEGATADSFEQIIATADVTGDHTWTFPNDQIADNEVLVGNGAGTFGYQGIPDCTDTGGNHLNFDASSNGFSCGTTSSGSGSGDITDVGDCSTGACLTADGTGSTIYLEGATADGFETIIATADVTGDATWTFPNDQISDDDILIGSGAGTFIYKAIPDCEDTGGNHLNYDTGSNGWSCGTTSSVTDTNTNAATICAGTNTYLDGEGGCDTLDGLEDFETATDDSLVVGNGTTFDTKAVADCDTNNRDRLQYDTATNAFSCDTDTLGTADIAGLDISDDTNLTCGRSLTVSGDGCDADTEIYTDTKGIWFEDPTAADDFQSIWTANGFAATITKIWCESDQTVNMDLQVDDGSPADVNGTDLVCDSTPAEDESMGGDATLADGDRLDLAITSVSGTPTWVSIMWTFTYDD